MMQNQEDHVDLKEFVARKERLTMMQNQEDHVGKLNRIAAFCCFFNYVI